ncbi:MAG: 2-hydroxyacyl-CoA dehydratase [Clostridiales bacterium]|nr:2-hydroxyacyl-CoA dehydratase [Candidatus Cacconaster stercorequi]
MTKQTEKQYSFGIDVGSTTVKLVVTDENEQRVYAKYQRHFADVRKTLQDMLQEVYQQMGDVRGTFAITGSGGLNLAKHIGIEFIQEVIAVTAAIRVAAPQTDVVIELGGEDAKIIFFTGGVEQRMNGICAGGTGAFIDQMAALLQTDASGLNEYAKGYRELYPIAARCGVFAKTDIQPLINDGVPREDLAASIFQAVVTQTISGLACGRRIRGNVAFLGGPLYFLSELRAAFIRTLNLTPEQAIFPEDAHLFAAGGAAAYSQRTEARTLGDVLAKLAAVDGSLSEMHCLPALFEDDAAYQAFRKRQSAYRIGRRDISTYEGDCFLGIDAGSTTMKLVLLSADGELLHSYYGSNKGDPLAVCRQAMGEIRSKLHPNARIVRSCSTGYGETLLKDAFCLDEGEVETISHYYAARFFQPDVDCILDIGGQDMKCIKIKDGCVDTIILNEACSSGCGSFIENFANSLGYTAQEFAQKALFAKKPVDLGTRCTIFMNSNVKQAQKEGASVEDIAAGLAYSVIKNALFKVIKLTDPQSLGRHIVVQGGTFYNDAILRGFELISEREAIRPDIAGLMGAFGAALIARERYDGSESTMLALEQIEHFTYETKTAHCGGCQNHCRLTVNLFGDGRRHISGNRCERGGQEKAETNEAPNLFAYKQKRLFDYEIPENAPRGTVGMPRVLNLYEDFPFWAVFFRQLGFRVVLSPKSSRKVFELGMDSIPSESECYPAKLAHGHVQWLIEQGVDTIFYPCVYYERQEREAAQNHYNCPMVISYPENIRNNMEDLQEKNIRFLDPFVAFTDEEILGKRLCQVMEEEFQIPQQETAQAVHAGWQELMRFREDVLNEGKRALQWIEENNGHGIVLAGRPYHLDPEVNHGIPEMIHSFGFAVLTEDSVAPLQEKDVILRATNQWTYHARLYAAAGYVVGRDDLDLVQLNSFGCGLDAVTVDQVQELLTMGGKMYTLLKIDEVNNLGAARIRVRSMMAALRLRSKLPAQHRAVQDYHRLEYTEEMHRQGYTILVTEMAPLHFDFIGAAFRSAGYRLVMMKNESQRVLDMGLKYVNNDACYPTMIVTGQIIDEVTSGKYDTDHLAVMMTQTGGGCRASNYVGFIRKALKDAGYPQIPVISINANGMETNSGLHFAPRTIVRGIQGVIYGDIFMRVLYRMRPYEKEIGSVNALHEKWKEKCIADISAPGFGVAKFYRNCRQIIRDFDRIPVHEDMKKPRVGIVGEVLVKFMPLANNHLADQLEREGAEVVMPDLIEFLQYCFWSSIYRAEYLGGGRKDAWISKIGIGLSDLLRSPVTRELKRSRHFSVPSKLKKVRQDAQKVLQLGNQCGEGWFLAGEMVDLIREGVPNIVCAQPFGCLPNHIVGKGVVKRLKELYPQANVAAIDYDPSASRVNQLNRIKLMLEVARENLEKES